MTPEEIQKVIDAFPAMMSAKGLKMPGAQFHIEANAGPCIYLRWDTPRAGDRYQFIHGDSVSDAESMLNKAEDWIAALPTIEERRMNDFLSSLSETIERGKATGIDVEFINPLIATMKRISRNALTDQRSNRDATA